MIGKSGIMSQMKQQWLIGIDEAGEKVWETFARGCLVFLEFTKEMPTTCTVPVNKFSFTAFATCVSELPHLLICKSKEGVNSLLC